MTCQKLRFLLLIIFLKDYSHNLMEYQRDSVIEEDAKLI